jgi:hypothetical protein
MTSYTNDDSGTALGRNRLAMHHASRDMHEVTGIQLDHLSPIVAELDGHRTIGDVGIRGVVTVMVPSGRGSTGKSRESRPHTVMSESFTPQHSTALLPGRARELFLTYHFRAVHVVQYETVR